MKLNIKLIKIYLKNSKKTQKTYYSNLLIKSGDNTKKSWKVIKEILGRSEICRNNLPKHLDINKKLVYDQAKIADEFNNFFVNVGENLGQKIPASPKSPISYLKNFEKTMNQSNLTEDELIKAFHSLKSNKSQGIDEISVNVVKKTFDIIKIPLLYIFNLSLNTRKLPNKRK
jgi:hypothetical protein